MSDRWKGFRRAFRLPLGARVVRGEVKDELSFHLEERVEELVAAGLSREEAEQEARARFGDVGRIGTELVRIDRRRVRRRSFAEALEAIWRDTRFAVRSLRRSPGFSAVAVLTLALGIGASTAIFSAVNGVLLRPLAVPQLDRLYVVRQDVPGLKLLRGTLTPVQAEELARRDDLFEVFAGVAGSSFNLTGDAAGGGGEPQRLSSAQTMGRFFELFSLVPALGSFYRPQDSENGNHHQVVLSDGFWRSWAGGDPGVIGRSLELNGTPYRVVGVLPQEFRYRQSAQIFVPLVITQRMREQGPWMITALGRLRPELGKEQVGTRLAAFTAAWQAEPSRAYRSELQLAFTGTPLVQVMAGELRPLLLLLLVAVGLLLLIGCANVANLQLVRAAGRAKELAVRSAMGAGRWPVLRQLVLESALLAGTGGALGLGLALLLVRALRGLGASQYPLLQRLELDGPVLGFTAAITMLAVVLSGIAPSLRASRANAQSVLRDAGGSRSSPGPERARLLRASAAVQVALSLILLLGAGLLIRSLALLLDTDPGFAPARVLTFRVGLPSSGYQEAQRVLFFEQLVPRLAGLPGVEAAGAISDLPFGEGRNSSPFEIEGKPVGPAEPQRHADMRFVQGDYFRSTGIPVLRGRTFTSEDRRGTPWVAVIDQSLARQYFGSEDPIGRRISQGPTSTIIGVVGAVKHGDLTEPDKPTIYYSYSQAPWYSGLYLTLRTRQEPAALLAEAKARVAELDPKLPVYDIETMQRRVDRSLETRRLAMLVLTGFAVLAVLLALLGVYGVLSYSTSRRTHELGIRMALGALRGDVIRMVLGSGLALTGLGLALGLAGFLLAARLLKTILYGITPQDPITIVAGTTLLGVCAALAAYLPARRAARVDPVTALRDE